MSINADTESQANNDSSDVRSHENAQTGAPTPQTTSHAGLKKILVKMMTEPLNGNALLMKNLGETLNCMRKHYKIADAKKNQIRRKERIIVEVKVNFLKIIDIVTINQTFDAEIFIQAKWEEPWLEGMSNTLKVSHLSNAEIENLVPWYPNLTLLNVNGSLDVDKKSYDIKFNESGYTYPVVYLLWRMKGTFKENLELQDFPLDIQELTITVSTDRTVDEVVLIEDQTKLSSVEHKAFMDAAEWKLFKHVETGTSITTGEHGSSQHHPVFNAYCRVARKVNYFVWNAVFVMFLIVVLTICGHQIPFDNSDRLVLTALLFLVAIAFKLMLLSDQANIDHLTYLDKWTLGCILYLVLQGSTNALLNSIGRFMPIEEVTFIDKWSMLGMTLLLAIGSIFYGIYVFKSTSGKRILVLDKERLYKEKKKYVKIYGKMPPTRTQVNLGY